MWLRQRTATRNVPLVFAGGEPDKVDPIRALLPDAGFVDWDAAAQALAAARGPERPVVPGTMDAYAGTGLVPKLGIRAGSRVRLLGPPDGFAAKLSALPEDARLENRGRADVVLLFVRTGAELQRRLESGKRAIADGGSLWVVWPKRASGVPSDLTQPVVRGIGMASGLVDYKVAAIEETWTGLRLARRTG